MSIVCCSVRVASPAKGTAPAHHACTAADIWPILNRLKHDPAVEEALCVALPGLFDCYLLAHDVEAARQAVQTAWHEVHAPSAVAVPELTVTLDAHAVEHLIRTASGVAMHEATDAEALVTLEGALDTALLAGACGGRLALLARRAIRVGRELRERDPHAARLVQLCDLAVGIVGKVYSRPGELRVLLLGAGATARTIARRFRREPIARLAMAAPDSPAAEALAHELDAESIPMCGVFDALGDYDVLVFATYGVDLALPASEVRRAANGRRMPMVLLDLSTPTCLHPHMVDKCNVFPYPRTALEAQLPPAQPESDPARREREAAVSDATAATMRLLEWPAVAELLAELRARAEGVRRTHLQKYGRKLGDEERARFDTFTDSLLRTILSDVAANLEGIDPATPEGREAFETTRRLLGLDAPREATS